MLFLDREKDRQESFRRRHWPELEEVRGASTPGRTHPRQLSRGDEGKAFFPPAAAAILAYCRNRLPIQTPARDLRSSLVACVNTLFPLRGHPAAARLALEPALPGLSEVGRIEFLFPWREAAQRGERTVSSTPRADAAVWWREASGGRRLSLVCWSYTEASYGTCGGFRSRNNPFKRHCLEMNLQDPDQAGGCYLSREASPWLPWDRLAETGIRPDAFPGVAGCPFRGPFYQIMRMFVLAAALRQQEEVDQVDVVFVGFRGNTQVTRTPAHLAPLGSDIIRAWNRGVQGVPELRYVCAEEIVAGLGRDRSDAVAGHLAYLKERYGLGPEAPDPETGI